MHDSETILLYEKALLQDQFELFLARNGQEALDASRAMELDAVLMDYSMPVMDGEAALVAMRATPSTAQLPVVIVTGETNARCGNAARRRGRCVLKKPINPVELQSAIARALRR